MEKKLHEVIFPPISLKEIEVIGNTNMLSMQRVLNAITMHGHISVENVFTLFT
jgi:hypothetical protein